MKKIIIISTLCSLLFTLCSGFLVADEYEDLQKQIDELSRARQMSVDATKPLEGSLMDLEARLDRVQSRLNTIMQGIINEEASIVKLESSIEQREVDLAYQQEVLIRRVRSFYIKKRYQTPLTVIFSASKATEITRQMVFRKAGTDEDKKVIFQVATEIVKLSKDKKEAASRKESLETEKVSLAGLQAQVDKEAEFFRKEIAGAKAYQADLTTKIVDLTARQKAILAEKTGTFQTSVGDVPLADDPNSRPDYNPGFSPAFAAFSFGAPHFKGMSQYGAWGRAKAGQNEEEILKAYYGDVRLETVDTNFDINTDQGRISMENRYLFGIAEMPSSWEDNNKAALKAQAIAARSYALSYVGWRMGNRSASGSICTSENCQVYRSSKADGTPGSWRSAVEETRGKIVVSNSTGEIISTWYASTSGGYQESYSSLGHSTPGFWDTPSGRDGWTSEAYEKQAGSPWFYKGWYKSRSGKECGRSYPWLSQDEFVDIVNAAWVYAHDGSSPPHLSQTDAGSCWGGEVPDTWSRDRVRQEADKHGGAISSISSIDVFYGTNGVTSKLVFQTDRGSKEIDGQQFYKVFNLRAPGVIHLKSGLFNIERK